MKKIEAVQDRGYGQHEYDLIDEDGYVGLLLGTKTRFGIIWEVQEYTAEGNIGKVMRVPVMTFTQVMEDVQIFLGR